MPDADLTRFNNAQSGVYDLALAELRAGLKTSHWMWFVFPQIAGLGASPTSRYYAIRSAAEARAFLAHPVLGSRLRACTEALLRHEDRSAEAMLGSIDATKLRSSMTLFEAVSAGEDARLFGHCLDRFFAGMRDPMTLRLLAPPPD
jgi:uncharacterized protein (DUF1810 family)